MAYILATLVAMCTFCACQIEARSPPNIIFLLVDDLGWGNVGYHSPTNPEINTPNIDRLATQEGLRLNRHYVHFSCGPTRSSFQSGRLPAHVNLANADPSSNEFAGVAYNMTIIAEILKNSKYNYSTHMIGKWDAGSTLYEQTPLQRGYDTFYGYLSHANTHFNKHEWARPCLKEYGFQIYDLWENDGPAGVDNINSNVYEELIFAQKMYDLIESKGKKHKNHKKHKEQKEQKENINITDKNNQKHNPSEIVTGPVSNMNENMETDEPFFIVYASHLSHDPLQIDKDYYTIFDNDESNCSVNDPFIYPGFNKTDNTTISTYHCRSIVQSMINLLDIIVGNITTILKENGLWNNTLIIFTGDNGGCQRMNICAGNNYPLRGGKFVPFEGGIRTATFVTGMYFTVCMHVV